MTPAELAAMPCEPSRGGVHPLRAGDCAQYLGCLDGWSIVDEHHLSRVYKFADFVTALDFTNAVGALAEEVGHHPEITVGWGQVAVKLWTHSIDGLHAADFILAARIDRIPRS